MKFAVADDLHCEPQGQSYSSREEAIAELERRARIPWNEEPNRATAGIAKGNTDFNMS
jgi:hypothetical protein